MGGVTREGWRQGALLSARDGSSWVGRGLTWTGGPDRTQGSGLTKGSYDATD